MRKLLLLILSSVFLLTACSKTPMEKLQSDSAYTDLTEQFSAQQRIQKTPLWKEAKAYCQQNLTKQNCAPVLRQIFFDGSTDIPKYGSSKSHIEIPNF